MPTASTAQILGNNESFEPFTSNMFTRRVLAGEFAVVNKYLLNDLIARGLWTPEIRNQIIADKGSVQSVAGIPDDLKALYKTTWEIKQRALIDMAADRGAFIDQSQSFNVFVQDPNYEALVDALLRVEEGPQGGDVLPACQGGLRRDQVHRRPGVAAPQVVRRCPQGGGNSSLKESGRASPTPAPRPRGEGASRAARDCIDRCRAGRYVVSVRTCVRIKKMI